MNAADVIKILTFATQLLEGVVGGSAVNIALALEQLAAAVNTSYQAETGKPIDPSIFNVEAPLEAAPPIAGASASASTVDVLD